MSSKLTLKAERLAELTTDDLNRVAGAATVVPSVVGKYCLSLGGTACMTWNGCTTANSCGCEPTWDCA